MKRPKKSFRALLSLGFSAALALSLLGGTPAQAAPTTLPGAAGPARTVDWNPHASWTEHYIVTKDRTTLHADVLRPKHLKPTDKTPVIAVVSPYVNHFTDQGLLGALNGSGVPNPLAKAQPRDRFADVVNGAKLLEAGYTFMLVDLRGNGGSTGCLDFGGPGEQQDVVTAVEWAASQPWSNGKVGLYGKSYDGATALQVVANRPKGLKAAIAMEPMYDTYTYLFHNGVPYYNALFMGSWYNQIAATPGLLTDSPEYLQNSLWTARNPVCMVKNQLDQYDDNPDSPYWQKRRFVSRVNTSPIPLFVIQGFIEDNTRADGLVTLLRNRKAPTRAWLGMWEHIRGNDTTDDGRLMIGRTGWYKEVRDFFDHYLMDKPLKGYPNIIVQDNTGSWRGQEAWPNTDPDTTSVWTVRGPKGTVEDKGLAIGANTTTGGGSLPPALGLPLNSSNPGIWKIGTPLKRDMRISGHVSVWALADYAPQDRSQSTSLVADLYDVAPNGDVILIQRGAIKVTPGKKMLKFNTFATDWLLRKGHQLAIRFVNTNTEVYFHVPQGDDIKVLDSRLYLPIDNAKYRKTHGGNPTYWEDYMKETGHYPGPWPVVGI